MVRTNGTRGALLTVMRNGKASTLAVVNGVKKALPKILAGLPPELNVSELFDQSLFVRAAINGVVREGGHRGGPDGADDPAVPGELAQHADRLHFDSAVDPGVADRAGLLGQTINVMTLGGMALAVGILVDDATVEIENISPQHGDEASRWCGRCWTARSRSRCRRSSRRCPSASCSCRCCC